MSLCLFTLWLLCNTVTMNNSRDIGRLTRSITRLIDASARALPLDPALGKALLAQADAVRKELDTYLQSQARNTTVVF